MKSADSMKESHTMSMPNPAQLSAIQKRIAAACADRQPREICVEGRWVGLGGGPDRGLREIWERHVTGPVRDLLLEAGLSSESPEGLHTHLASHGGGAFMESSRWYGGTPGDALRTVCDMLFDDDVLVRVATVDSCTMRDIPVLVFTSIPERTSAIEKEVRAALLALAN